MNNVSGVVKVENTDGSNIMFIIHSVKIASRQGNHSPAILC